MIAQRYLLDAAPLYLSLSLPLLSIPQRCCDAAICCASICSTYGRAVGTVVTEEIKKKRPPEVSAQTEERRSKSRAIDGERA